MTVKQLRAQLDAAVDKIRELRDQAHDDKIDAWAAEQGDSVYWSLSGRQSTLTEVLAILSDVK